MSTKPKPNKTTVGNTLGPYADVTYTLKSLSAQASAEGLADEMTKSPGLMYLLDILGGLESLQDLGVYSTDPTGKHDLDPSYRHRNLKLGNRAHALRVALMATNVLETPEISRALPMVAFVKALRKHMREDPDIRVDTIKSDDLFKFLAYLDYLMVTCKDVNAIAKAWREKVVAGLSGFFDDDEGDTDEDKALKKDRRANRDLIRTKLGKLFPLDGMDTLDLFRNPDAIFRVLAEEYKYEVVPIGDLSPDLEESKVPATLDPFGDLDVTKHSRLVMDMYRNSNMIDPGMQAVMERSKSTLVESQRTMTLAQYQTSIRSLKSLAKQEGISDGEKAEYRSAWMGLVEQCHQLYPESGPTPPTATTGAGAGSGFGGSGFGGSGEPPVSTDDPLVEENEDGEKVEQLLGMKRTLDTQVQDLNRKNAQLQDELYDMRLKVDILMNRVSEVDAEFNLEEELKKAEEEKKKKAEDALKSLSTDIDKMEAGDQARAEAKTKASTETPTDPTILAVGQALAQDSVAKNQALVDAGYEVIEEETEIVVTEGAPAPAPAPTEDDPESTGVEEGKAGGKTEEGEESEESEESDEETPAHIKKFFVNVGKVRTAFKTKDHVEPVLEELALCDPTCDPFGHLPVKAREAIWKDLQVEKGEGTGNIRNKRFQVLGNQQGYTSTQQSHLYEMWKLAHGNIHNFNIKVAFRRWEDKKDEE